MEAKEHKIFEQSWLKIFKKDDIDEESNPKEEFKEVRKRKSRLFIRCHKLLLNTDKALQKNNIQKAKRLYMKSRGLYIQLEYSEEKEIYKDVMDLFIKLNK